MICLIPEGLLTRPVNIGLDDDADAANAVEIELDVLVLAAVAHPAHVLPAGVKLLVALSEDGILGELGGELEGLGGLDPRVVVEAALYVDAVDVAVEPDV
jgi:hypothetical protein